jgi:hypothetical protein
MLIRFLDNDTLEPDQINDLKDDIEYYISQSKETELPEIDYIYDELEQQIREAGVRCCEPHMGLMPRKLHLFTSRPIFLPFVCLSGFARSAHERPRCGRGGEEVRWLLRSPSSGFAHPFPALRLPASQRSPLKFSVSSLFDTLK